MGGVYEDQVRLILSCAGSWVVATRGVLWEVCEADTRSKSWREERRDGTLSMHMVVKMYLILKEESRCRGSACILELLV